MRMLAVLDLLITSTLALSLVGVYSSIAAALVVLWHMMLDCTLLASCHIVL